MFIPRGWNLEIEFIIDGAMTRRRCACRSLRWRVAIYNILQAVLLVTGRAGLALEVAEHDRAVVMDCVMVLFGPIAVPVGRSQLQFQGNLCGKMSQS